MASVRTALRDWLPPVLVRGRATASTTVHESYAHALGHCGAGYDDDEIAAVVVAKQHALSDGLRTGSVALDLGATRTLVGVAAAHGRSPLRVLDLGGAAGLHYAVARSVLPADVRLDWRVVETAAMVQAARSLASDELRFHTSIAAALSGDGPPVDLALAIGVLQYVPDPFETLAEIVASGASNLLISRTGLSDDDRTLVIVQRSRLSDNGPGPLPAGFVDHPVAYPGTFVPRRRFEDLLAAQYDVSVRLLEEASVWNAAGTPVHQYGYVCRRRPAG